MKIALYGGSGMIGSRLLSEALDRGHAVTLVVRDRRKFTPPRGRVLVVEGDVLDATSVAAAVNGHEAVLSAVGPTPEIVAGAARSLIEGLTRAGVRRLVVVGGAGTLEVAPGVLLLQTPRFPPEYEPVAQAHGAALNTFRQNTTLDWTFVSPAAFIEPENAPGRSGSAEISCSSTRRVKAGSRRRTTRSRSSMRWNDRRISAGDSPWRIRMFITKARGA